MEQALQSQISTYVSITQRIDQTHQDISNVASQIAQADAQLAVLQSQLETRAVAMYTSDQPGFFQMLLTTSSLEDFLSGTDYLMRINDYDNSLVDSVNQQRSQSAYLQQTLVQREAQLDQELASADVQRKQILAMIDAEQSRVKFLGGQVAALIAAMNAPDPVLRGTSPNITGFSLNTIISEKNFRASTSMSAADIQTFLDSQPGSLKSYSGPDHAGRTRTAAQMIADASVAWGVSPKVIIATLQKEQSLITVPPSQHGWDWAMGMGYTDSTIYTQYKGFSKQVWYGAQHLAHDGDMWKPGYTVSIDGIMVHPTNPATLSLLRYTPHRGGNANFWMLYQRFGFGNPNG